MIPPPLRSVLLAGAVLLLIGTAAAAQTPAGVTAKDFSFQPRELTIAAGAAVQWTNQDGAPHQVESDDGTVVGTIMSTGQMFSFTFATAGRVTYHCAIHPTMTGVIIVQ